MYIPLPLTRSIGSDTDHRSGPNTQRAQGAESNHRISVAKRQISISGGQTTNLTVGVTVGVAIFLFILGACAFCYFYRASLRKRAPRARPTTVLLRLRRHRPRRRLRPLPLPQTTLLRLLLLRPRHRLPERSRLHAW
ncbi:hypothetical protein Cob_v008353 [Colletotrichum orbiculare MAFF 240422]|uniref:Uncharacterized protein n=1 Tax=Colletotrichum orbiculare (strain 104-T / ATCC 96160 / CBS 514.97 / LARS 414 / MAFF 240422) TaxID=1213857 RepID=A0A484FP03_COLOR|nr:hypothetical protein Cob_v008353 [Colletotrichum orbiculare MAFF 240422]